MLYELYLEKYNEDIKKTETKISSEKQKLIKKIIFDKYLKQNIEMKKINEYYTINKVKKEKRNKAHNPIEHKKVKQQSIKDWLNNN